MLRSNHILTNTSTGFETCGRGIYARFWSQRYPHLGPRSCLVVIVLLLGALVTESLIGALGSNRVDDASRSGDGHITAHRYGTSPEVSSLLLLLQPSICIMSYSHLSCIHPQKKTFCFRTNVNDIMDFFALVTSASHTGPPLSSGRTMGACRATCGSRAHHHDLRTWR